MTARAAHRLRGFTLVEVLAASVLSAMLAGAFCAALASAVSLRERAESNLEMRRLGDRAEAVIRDDLRNALPPVDALIGDFLGERGGGFGSERSTLEFYTASGRLMEDEPWPRVQKVLYSIEKSADSNAFALFRSVTRNLLAPTEEDPVEEAILSPVDSLAIEYYDGEEWRETWDSAEQDPPLPEAVLFEATPPPDAEGRKNRPLRLYVPLLVQARPESEEPQDDSAAPAGEETGGQPSGGDAGGGSR